jgi:hypothetical protein
MKAERYFPILALFLAEPTYGATVSVSSGTPSQGFLVSTNGIPNVSQLVAVGSWNGSIFTQFGDAIVDTGKVSGVFTATKPPVVNQQVIHLWVGNGDTVNFNSGGQWALFRTTAGATFPADISGTSSITFAFTLPTTAILVESRNLDRRLGAGINFIPEPSVALLSLLGIIRLFRRCRI